MIKKNSLFNYSVLSLLIILFIYPSLSFADISKQPSVQKFMSMMVQQYGFNKKELTHLFQQVNFNTDVIEKMVQPWESKPWYIYQAALVTPTRIQQGAAFWNEYADALSRAQQEYGVPASIIVAIIGIESNYGQNPGKFSVLESLSTLAFAYPIPARAAYFQSELTQFLLLTRTQRLNPLTLPGSYAGAIGMPQFMPSSYRTYAVDFSGQNQIDLAHNPIDVIGSVANYFKAKGWQTGGRIVRPTHANNNPDVIVLEGENNLEYWLAYNNFRVIMRYNTSPLYAMAVYQLAQGIKTAHSKQLSEK